MCDDDPAATLALLAERSPAGIDPMRFCRQLNPTRLPRKVSRRRAGLRVIGDVGFAETGWRLLRTRLLEALARRARRARDMVGVERERLRRMTLATLPRTAFDALVDEADGCRRAGARTRAGCICSAHSCASVSADRDRSCSTHQAAARRATLQPAEARATQNKATGTPEDTTVRQLFRRLARAGELYPVAHDHYFTAAAAALATIVGAERGRAARAPPSSATPASTAMAAAAARWPSGSSNFFDRVGYTLAA